VVFAFNPDLVYLPHICLETVTGQRLEDLWEEAEGR
jgi:hypothetical protein